MLMPDRGGDTPGLQPVLWVDACSWSQPAFCFRPHLAFVVLGFHSLAPREERLFGEAAGGEAGVGSLLQPNNGGTHTGGELGLDSGCPRDASHSPPRFSSHLWAAPDAFATVKILVIQSSQGREPAVASSWACSHSVGT